MDRKQLPVNRWMSVGVVTAALSIMPAEALPLKRSFDDPTPTGGDEFGSFGAVALDGNYVLVGARFDDTQGFSVGQAHLFDAATGNLVRTFDDPTPTRQDYFGNSVALDGNQVLIGANRDDTQGNDVGQAYLFDAASGDLLQVFNDPTPTDGDWFGRSVAIDDGRVLIGARHDDTRGLDAGQAHLFDVATGNLLHTFNDPTPTGQGFFGHWVTLDGNYVLVSAVGGNEAHLFDAATGHLLRTFTSPGPGSPDRFAIAVAIEGNNVLIGNTGDAHLFDAATGDLLRTFDDPTPADTNRFGWSVALHGNLVLIGAVGDMFGAGSGQAHLFDVTSGSLLQTFERPTTASFDRFGESVALHGNLVLIGAPYDGTRGRYVGQAHLFSAPPLSFAMDTKVQEKPN
jgi:outer membrane protein assembly factor BamB